MHRRRGLTAGIIGAIAIALVLSLVGGAIGAKSKKKTVKASANLIGQEEVPPADLDGTGTADFTLTRKKGKPQGKVCFEVSFQNMGPRSSPTYIRVRPGSTVRP